MRADGARELRRGRPASVAHPARFRVGGGQSGCALLVERRGTCVVGREHREPLTGLVAVGDHLLEGLAVLADELVQEVPAASHLVEALGIVRDDVGSVAEVGGDVGGLGLEPVQPSLELLERGAPHERRPCDSDRVDRSAVAGERVACLGCGFAMCDRVGQPILFELERSVLVGGVELGTIELVDLVPEEVDLAGSRAFVAAECRELGLDLGDASVGLAQGRQVDAAEPIERAALLRDAEQRLVAVLPMEVDEAATFIRELRDGREAAVAIGP